MVLALLLAATPVFAEEFVPPQGNGKGVIGGRGDQAWRKTIAESFELSEISALDTPSTGHWSLYATSAGVFIEDDQGAATQITAGSGDNTLDDAYDQGGVGAGRTITVDQGAVQLDGSHATNDTFFVNKTAGTGDAIQVTNAGTGNDVTGTSSTWSVTKTGAATFTGLVSSGAASSVNASSNFATSINTGTSTGTVLVGSGLNSVGVDSSSWDITTVGAASVFTSLSLSDDITMANGKGVKGSTTTGETVAIQAYDVDNTTYRNAILVTNGDSPAIAIGTNNETLAINTADWDISTTGAITGAGAITADGTLTINAATAVTLYSNEAVTVGHATNGAADDLTIGLTGATDSSVIVSSTGTGTDAISLQASAGGVDVDAAAAQDVNIAGGQVALVSKDDAASAISLTSNIGTTETIVVTNTQGTSESAVTLLSTAGGVNVDAAAAKDVDIAGGQVKLVSKDDAAGSISLTANIGTSETITVTNTQGTSESAVTLLSTAGGVNIDAAGGKDVDIAGGQVLISSKTTGASAIALTTNQGIAETIVVTNTQGTDAGAITLTSTAGGIALNASSGITTGDAVTGDGTAALGGFLKTVTDDTDAHSVLASESGTVLTNAGAGAPAAHTLPAAVAGLNYCFVVMAAQELRPTPAADDVINIAGVAGDAAEYWTANAVGETLCLVAVDGTNWVATSYTGTWTQQTP
jgi:hypothetical protein